MGEFNKLSFEIENRSILIHKDTSLQDGNIVDYIGDPNNVNPSNSDGELLIFKAPGGSFFLDKSSSPFDVYIKIEDSAGGF
jgi:hypothetical protein